MEFGRHIGKGMWGLAGRALPSVYGIGIIVFVIRTFPPVEFGVYTLLQTIFLLAMAMGQSFALQSLVKFGAETDRISGPVCASAILYTLFSIPAALALFASGSFLGVLFNSGTSGDLMYYVSLMLLVSVPRNIASYLLQSKLELKKLFFLDALYSLGSLLLIGSLYAAGLLHSAEGLMRINLLTLALSSVFGTVILLKTYAVRFQFSQADLRNAWSYGKYSLGATISFTLYSQSDNLIISAFLGPVQLAIYNAAKVFTRAYDLMIQLINTLLVPVVSRSHSRNDTGALKILAEKSLLFFTLAALTYAVLLLVLGPALMGAIYGDKYPDSVPILYVLASAGIFIPGIAVGAAFCNGVAKMKPVFYFNLLTAAVGIPLMAYLTSAFGIMGAAATSLTMFGLLCPTWIYVLVRHVGVPVSAGSVFGRYTDILGLLKRWSGHA
jgi:O-antigen/teichoic acid export membrane protein